MSYNLFIYITEYKWHELKKMSIFSWKVKLCTNIIVLLTTFFIYLHICRFNTLCYEKVDTDTSCSTRSQNKWQELLIMIFMIAI